MIRRSLLAAVVLLAGCASVPKRGGFDDVSKLSEQRAGYRVHWKQGDAEDAQVDARLRELLKAPLTLDSAVEIALLNNPGLQATFEDLGVAQADLVQAGLLRNPVLGASVLIPLNAGATTGIAGSLTQEFIDLFTLPLRKRVAAAAFDQSKLRVSDAVLQLAAETRNAYRNVQGAQQITAMWRIILDAAESSQELAQRQYAAGNLNELSLTGERTAYEQARLDLKRSEATELAAREQLTRLLGLWGSDINWKIEAPLPDLPKEEVQPDQLEALAVAQRLDLGVAQKETQTLQSTLSLARGTRWVGSVQVGVSAEKDAENNRLVGPTLQVELPIFDQHQAGLARLEAQVRQSERRTADLTVAIRSEVRATTNRLLIGRQVVEHYRTILLPLRQRLVTLSQQHYNAMLLGVYQLLLAKQAEISSYREYIEAVRDYWIARSDLERAIGGRLTEPSPHVGATP